MGFDRIDEEEKGHVIFGLVILVCMMALCLCYLVRENRELAEAYESAHYRTNCEKR